MLLHALGLRDQVTGMKSRVASFHPKIQLWKQLLIWLNLLHGIAAVKPWECGWRRVKGGVDIYTPISAPTSTQNSELKFKTPSPIQHSTARAGCERKLSSETPSRATLQFYHLTAWGIKIWQKKYQFTYLLTAQSFEDTISFRGADFSNYKRLCVFTSLSSFP